MTTCGYYYHDYYSYYCYYYYYYYQRWHNNNNNNIGEEIAELLVRVALDSEVNFDIAELTPLRGEVHHVSYVKIVPGMPR